MKNIWRLALIFPILLFTTCKPISQDFADVESAKVYTAKNLTNNPYPTEHIKIMSWNIRFGIARFDWFGDACGDNTIFSQDEVLNNVNAIVAKINFENPDILYLQECDVNSKRTNYLNEIDYILNNTNFNYAYYAPVWDSQFVPSHGLGKVYMGIVILSKWPLNNAQRIALPLREDQGSAEKYFYLRYCYLKAELNLVGFKSVNLINVHSVAFATDDTKKKQYEKIIEELKSINNSGNTFVCGGDFNTLPPGATQLDFCLEDKCPEESFHNPGDNPQHKEGSNYVGEDAWVSYLFNNFNPSLPLAKYLLNQSQYFTHTTRHPNHAMDRRLDYFFTNYSWVNNSDTTFLDAQYLSDHAPISVTFNLPK